jgi:hypothetical protein
MYLARKPVKNKVDYILNIKDLFRQFKRRHHPDKGGKHETFIRLNRAFEDLLRRITSGQTTFRYRPQGIAAAQTAGYDHLDVDPKSETR